MRPLNQAVAVRAAGVPGGVPVRVCSRYRKLPLHPGKAAVEAPQPSSGCVSGRGTGCVTFANRIWHLKACRDCRRRYSLA